MFQDILEPKVENQKFKFRKNCLNNMVSDSCKKTASWPLKTLKQILEKRTKNMKLSTIFGSFWGLNNLSYLIFEDTFRLSIFPKLNFLFLSQDTGRPRNMNKLDLNILDALFL